MKRKACRAAVLLFAALLAGPLSMAQDRPPAPAEASSSSRVLVPGEVIDGNLKGTEAHRFRIPLAAGDCLTVSVDQKEIDVVLVVLSPAGEPLFQVNTPTGARGIENLWAVAVTAGVYTVEVRGADPKASGHYSLEPRLRPATPADRSRVKGQRLGWEARQLQDQMTAESTSAAIGKFRQSLAFWKEANDIGEQGRTLNYIGELQQVSGDLKGSVETLRQAPTSSLEGNDKAINLIDLGTAYFHLSEQREALAYLDEALTIVRTTHDRGLEAIVLNTSSLALGSLGERQQALTRLREALAIRREVKDRRGEATTLTNIAGFLYQIGDLQQAHAMFEQALAIRREVGDRLGEAATLTNFALCLIAEGQPREAVDRSNEARRIFQELGDKWGEAQTFVTAGDAERLLEHRDPAAELLGKAVVACRELGDRPGEAAALVHLGMLDRERGHLDSARETLRAARKTEHEIANTRMEAVALYEEARVESDRGDLAAARSAVEESLRLSEDLRSRFASPQLRMAALASTQDFYRFYVDLLMRMHRQNASVGLDIAAFEATERGRARALLETISARGIEAGAAIPEDLAAKSRRARDQLSIATDRHLQMLARKTPPERVAAQAKQVDTLASEYDGVEAEIRARNPRYAALTRPAPTRVADVQKALEPDTMLLEYSLGDDRSYVWEVTRASVRVHELPARSKIEAASRRVYEAWSTPSAGSGSDLARAGAELGGLVLSPMAARLSVQRLLIVADGLLQYVPFAALTAPGQTAPLITRHEVVSLPSGSIIPLLRSDSQHRTFPAGEIAVLADPVFAADDERVSGAGRAPTPSRPAELRDPDLERSVGDLRSEESAPGFARLPFTRREAQAIVALVPANRAKRALDFEASYSTATSPELSRYRFVHFATHGILNNEHPALSGLVFSLVDSQGQPQKGFLTTPEVFGLKLPVELVVLSACRTAIGKDVRGEGIVGLTRAFMYAGAQRVVSSVWKVNDAATAALMKHFYEGMLGSRRLRPAAALREAQLAIRQDPRWSSPYYWSGFVLQGEWR